MSVLAEDCLLTMPPAPLAYRGRDAIGSFFATVPAGGDLTAIRLVPARANGQPAVAAYLRDGDTARAYGIMVLTVHAGLIGEITGFADPELFPLFGLPTQADWPPGRAGSPHRRNPWLTTRTWPTGSGRCSRAAEAVTERQMFGGLAFMLGGHMFCGVVKDTLMVRLGPDGADRALDQPHVRPMDFTGRPMKGMVFVEPGGLHGAALRHWVDAAARIRPQPAAQAGRTRRPEAPVTSRGQPRAVGANTAGRLAARPGLIASARPATSWTVRYSPRLAWAHAG